MSAVSCNSIQTNSFQKYPTYFNVKYELRVIHKIDVQSDDKQ